MFSKTWIKIGQKHDPNFGFTKYGFAKTQVKVIKTQLCEFRQEVPNLDSCTNKKPVVSCSLKYRPFSSRDTYFLFQVGKKEKKTQGRQKKNLRSFSEENSGFAKKTQVSGRETQVFG